MKKALVVGGVAVGGIVLGRRLVAACKACSVEEMLERMPDTAPPKWMFRNIAAIRANTEQILARLEERERVAAPDEGQGIAA